MAVLSPSFRLGSRCAIRGADGEPKGRWIRVIPDMECRIVLRNVWDSFLDLTCLKRLDQGLQGFDAAQRNAVAPVRKGLQRSQR